MNIDWERWERTWQSNGLVVDRPRGSAHPRYHRLVYPVDYGYIPGTVGGDGDEVDVFIGHSQCGLVGAIFTKDVLKRDEEIKLLIDMSIEEIEQAHEFLKCAGMETVLVRRER